MKKTEKTIKSILGDNYIEDMKKNAILKENSMLVTDMDEIKVGMQIVPRVIMSFLLSNLTSMEVGENKELDFPFDFGTKIHVLKKDNDIYSGYFYKDGKKTGVFDNKSIPGVGLTILSNFELYSLENLKENREEEKKSFDISLLQKMIDDRLKLHNLISQVVEQKMAQRDAIEMLVREKIEQSIKEKEPIKEEVEKKEDRLESPKRTGDKLKRFLENLEKVKSNIEIEKKEHIDCPSCGESLYKGENKITLCICYGEDWNKEIKIKKTEKSIKMNFPKDMGKENIEILLSAIKNKK